MAVRRINYRLYPSAQASEKMHWARKAHCDLYNAALRNRQTQYRRFGKSVDYFEQQNSLPAFKETWPEYKELGSHTLQATRSLCCADSVEAPATSLKRVDFAYQRFFNGLSRYPKFKAKRRYRGWTYPDLARWAVSTNNGVHGRLELRDLGLTVQMRGKARTWGNPTTCTILWDGRHWYASITVNCIPERETQKGAIGLDFGCKTAIATSNGELIEAPKFQAKAAQKVKRLSKRLRRKRRPEKGKTKASRRWRKTQRQSLRLSEKLPIVAKIGLTR